MKYTVSSRLFLSLPLYIIYIYQAAYTKPTATDNVDGVTITTNVLNVDCQPVSGTVLAIGTHTVTCNAQDAAGNC